jgi:hypothetical protein
MDWSIVLPIFARILTPHGSLAIVERSTTPTPWDESLATLIRRFSTNREYQPYDLVEELQKRRLFRREGIFQTQPETFIQSPRDFVESIHSRNGFSRQRMGTESAEAFDYEVANLLSPYLQEGWLTFGVIGHVVWGRPETL